MKKPIHITAASALTAASVVIVGAANAQVSCQQIGTQTYCSNNQNFQQIGPNIYDNRGNGWQRIGPNTYGSDGSVYQRIGQSVYCR